MEEVAVADLRVHSSQHWPAAGERVLSEVREVLEAGQLKPL